MNLLIVDDEYYSVENLQRKISENRTNFTHIFCAYSMEEAVECIKNNEIALMICDIEMPGGSGIELLDYLRSRQVDTICIFLTAYAKFEYISRAMKLSSMDYLLKPVEDSVLFAAIDKALIKYHQQRNAQIDTLYAGYWKESGLYLLELFWQDLLSGFISSESSAIIAELKYRKLDTDLADRSFILLLIQCIFASHFKMDKSLFEFVLKNIVREYFYKKDEQFAVVRLTEQTYLLPLPAENRNINEIVERCQDALKEVVSYFTNTFHFFVAPEACTMAGAGSVFSLMSNMARENVSLGNRVFDLSSPFSSHFNMPDKPFPIKRWTDLLLQREVSILKEESLLWLNQLQHSGKATYESLRGFYFNFLQMLFSYMEKNNSDALSLFKEAISHVPEEQNCAPFYALKAWTQEILSLYEKCMANTANRDTAVATVKLYIQEHLSEELGRDALAAMVYLNPDYLSHIFKRETGLSLTNYIIFERIEAAKYLLSQNNMSIRDIAINCGFQNISYFSKQFKKTTGMTPREFRK